VFASETPMARIASVEEMVGPTIFLLSPAASFVTGVDLMAASSAGRLTKFTRHCARSTAIQRREIVGPSARTPAAAWLLAMTPDPPATTQADELI